MQSPMIDIAMGALLGGLVLSACWGWLWVVIGTVGFARGVCAGRVVAHSLTVGVIPLLLASWVWWMRHDMVSSTLALIGGLLVMPLIVLGLGLRKAADGRCAGLHMVESIRHLKNELLGGHHDCGGCDHRQGADRGGCS